MLCTDVPRAAKSLNSAMGMSNSDAISSMNAPVPPAQLPFMRMSATFSLPVSGSGEKNAIFASWPPSSMAVRVCG